MSLFGKNVIKEVIKNEPSLQKACFNCGGDMHLKRYREYFSIFDFNIIPLQTVDTFYECSGCGSAHSLSLKSVLELDETKKERKFEDSKKLYTKALIASLTLMAGIDGEYARLEEYNLHAILGKYSNDADELLETMDFVKRNGNKENYVYNLLQKVREELSAESVLNLLTEAGQMIPVDGKIAKEELILMNAYVLASGLPKSLYKVLIEKMKA